MRLKATFSAGRGSLEKLSNALECANELSSIICSLHNRKADVQVILNKNSELKWAINSACCPELKKELAGIIEHISAKL